MSLIRHSRLILPGCRDFSSIIAMRYNVFCKLPVPEHRIHGIKTLYNGNLGGIPVMSIRQVKGRAEVDTLYLLLVGVDDAK